jgi:hypothetical protein
VIFLSSDLWMSTITLLQSPISDNGRNAEEPWRSRGYRISTPGYNFIAREKKEKIEGSDVDYIMNYMTARKDENPEFYFYFSVDDEGRLKNIFWSDS